MIEDIWYDNDKAAAQPENDWDQEKQSLCRFYNHNVALERRAIARTLGGFVRIIFLSPSRQDRRDTLSLRKSIDRSRDTIFHHRLAKVQQVAESHAGELLIRQELLLVGVVDTLN